MNKLIIINGTARVGKDTFSIMLINEFEKRGIPARKISSIDHCYQAAKLLGWDGIKNEVGRKFLSDLKDLSSGVFDGPFKYMKEEYEKFDGVTLVHIREPEEIQKVKNRITGVDTILVYRNGVQQFDNHADQGVNGFNYDYEVDNNGTLEDLKRLSKLTIKSILDKQEKTYGKK